MEASTFVPRYYNMDWQFFIWLMAENRHPNLSFFGWNKLIEIRLSFENANLIIKTLVLERHEKLPTVMEIQFQCWWTRDMLYYVVKFVVWEKIIYQYNIHQHIFRRIWSLLLYFIIPYSTTHHIHTRTYKLFLNSK